MTTTSKPGHPAIDQEAGVPQPAGDHRRRHCYAVRHGRSYRQKLDAAKKVRKLDQVQGVRNLIAVSSSAPDAELQAKLERKLHYDRIGYDNQFNFVDVSVKNGVATLTGEIRSDLGRDSALASPVTCPA